MPKASAISLTMRAAIHAMPHCHSTTEIAHLEPNSRLMEAMAATQGVYSRQNTSREAAEAALIAASMPPCAPKSTSSTETTLSFAMNPLIREVTILQSPSPSGLNIGTSNPDMAAKMLS